MASELQHAPGVVVNKDAVRVEAVADAGEKVPSGLPLEQRTGVLIVTLAPTWPAGIFIHDCLDDTKIGLEFHHGVLMDTEVAVCHAYAQ